MTVQILLLKMLARTELTIRLSEFCLIWGLDQDEVVAGLGVEDTDEYPLVVAYALSKLPGDKKQYEHLAKGDPSEFIKYAKRQMSLKKGLARA
jgi:hypothetical protein